LNCRYKPPLSLSERYDQLLFVFDVRLASVRWALNVRPVDDDYEPPPAPIQDGKIRVPEQILLGRISKAKKSFLRAKDAAQVIDSTFACDFRTSDVLSRRKRLRRLEELASGQV
jgi:hypothetical protein